MRILKYLILLLLLVLVGLVVFVSTSKGTYSVERSRVIKLPKSALFTYVADFKNWEAFGPWVGPGSGAELEFPAVTSGKGAWFSWESGNDEGKITSAFLKENDSIFQRMNFNGAESAISWKFKDTVGGTKVTWSGRGRMSFMYKIRSVMRGGIGKLISAIAEQSLSDLDETLKKELATHQITMVGMKDFPEVKYLKQSVSSRIDLAPANIRIMLAKMDHFFRKNKLSAAGKPFIRYEKWDGPNNLCRFSVCMPVAEEMHFTGGSDIQYGSMPRMTALKVTLKGDISHLDKARSQARSYLNEKQLQTLPKYRWIEVVSKGISETNRPSQWVTDLYYPVGIYQPEPVITTDASVSPVTVLATPPVRRSVHRDTVTKNQVAD